MSIGRIERLMESKGYAARRAPSEHAGGKWIYRYASALGGAGTIEVDTAFEGASSVKSVGHLGFWKFAEGMVQGHLSDVESPVFIGFSHRDLGLVVEAFYDGAREHFLARK
jgi:hypothetical protein